MLAYAKTLTELVPDVSRYTEKYREAAVLQMHWKEIIQSYDLQPTFYERNAVHLTRYAAAHRKLGNEARYQELMGRAQTLSLGLSKTLNSML
ncbi:hypothetical protein GCM10023107_01330 [Actinoplanes octamycinicus]